MTKKRNDNRNSEIINDYLSQRCDGEAGNRMMDSFAQWYFNEIDHQEKERLVAELEIQTSSDRVMTEQELENFIRRVEERRLAKKGKDKTHRLKSRFIRSITRVAAVLVPIMVVTGVWMYMERSEPVENFLAEYEVANGNYETKKLADSTEVSINAGSKLVINQSKTQRVAELKGESYFKVTKDEARPFVVRTQDFTVTVLGTEFNVEAYPDSDITSVTLNSGKIAVNTISGQHFDLEPNQKFIYTRSIGKGVVQKLEKESENNASEWENGMLVLDEVTLSEAFKIIERRYIKNN